MWGWSKSRTLKTSKILISNVAWFFSGEWLLTKNNDYKDVCDFRMLEKPKSSQIEPQTIPKIADPTKQVGNLMPDSIGHVPTPKTSLKKRNNILSGTPHPTPMTTHDPY